MLMQVPRRSLSARKSKPCLCAFLRLVKMLTMLTSSMPLVSATVTMFGASRSASEWVWALTDPCVLEGVE